MTKLFRAAAAVAALALSAPALAQHAVQTQQTQPTLGLGAGITSSNVSGSAAIDGHGSPDFGTLFFVPINVNPQVRIEPFIGWARADLDSVPAGVGGNQQFSPFLQGKSSDFTLGIGAFLVKPVAPQVQLYAGGRLGSQWQSIEFNNGDKAKRRNTLLAVAAGGEYLPVPRVAFGAELQLGYMWYGYTDYSAPGAGSISGGGGSGSATQATFFARFYLF